MFLSFQLEEMSNLLFSLFVAIVRTHVYRNLSRGHAHQGKFTGKRVHYSFKYISGKCIIRIRSAAFIFTGDCCFPFASPSSKGDERRAAAPNSKSNLLRAKLLPVQVLLQEFIISLGNALIKAHSHLLGPLLELIGDHSRRELASCPIKTRHLHGGEINHTFEILTSTDRQLKVNPLDIKAVEYLINRRNHIRRFLTIHPAHKENPPYLKSLRALPKPLALYFKTAGGTQ